MKKLFSLKTAILAFAVFALVGFAFSGSKAYAAGSDSSATPTPTPAPPVSALGTNVVSGKYVASEDAIVFDKPGADVEVKVLKFKSDSEESIKKALNTVKVTAASGASISLTAKDDKLKMGALKDTFLMIATDKFEDKVTTSEVKPDIKINASTVKKITMDLNYSVAAENATEKAVAALSVTLNESSAQAQTVKVEDYGKYEYAVKYKKADAPSKYQGLDTLTGGVLYTIMNNEDKADILVRAKGTDAELPSKTGVRPSASKKVSVKKPGKLAVVKFSTKTGLLAIKNGYDFSVQTSTASAIELKDWMTILRTNKNGTATKMYVAANEYVPVKFAADNTAAKASYTTEKLKGLSFATILKESGKTAEGDFYVYVRKSATEKAPASTFEAAKGYYHVNKVVAAPEIVEAVTGSAISASGASVKVKLKKNGADATPDSSVVFEYAIVKTDDSVDMDSLVWKSFKGTELTLKAANKKTSKYLKTGATAGTKAAAADATLDKCYILVRRQAALSDAAGKIKDQGLDVYQPSEVLKLKVTLGKDSKQKPVITEVTEVK